MVQLCERTYKMKIGFAVMHGITIGSFATSVGFYLQYDHWQPMVICAGVVGTIEAFCHFMRAIEP